MTFLLIVVALIIFLIVVNYNALQRLSQPVKEAASNVQIAISKKLNTINQLVDVVKSYQEAEQFTQLKVSQDYKDTAAMIASYQQAGNMMATIQGVAERFPNLKANEQYRELTGSIKECEGNIQHYRQMYNAAVKAYNIKRSSIPTVFIAQFLGFSEARYLEFDVAGNAGDDILKGFTTDDGQRLNTLLKNAGSSINSASKQIASQLGSAGKMVSEKIKDYQTTQYFYTVSGSVPKGPLPLAEIEKLINEGTLTGDVKVAEKDSDDWKDFQTLKQSS
ncbi:MAG TPA: LemA family protein [Ferruginibacter sp.]|jgi:LemA protein|nr:LemA family protein [Bacteroidota bacterium]MBS1926473.1 LemA family protein [Bacteroidota bacterium]MCC6693925.1 LemA family protein [Chitinophagaceae bacterium]HMT96576.1 LemA family protein [Ferruginibacter sp.]HMU23419.1 LemA family protein [Ferruginibacter sp.]